MAERMMTLREFAARNGLKASTLHNLLYRARRRGQPTPAATPDGNRYLYVTADLQAFFADFITRTRTRPTPTALRTTEASLRDFGLLSVPELATKYGVSETTILRHLKQPGAPKPIRPQRTIGFRMTLPARYDATSFDEFLTDHFR